MIREVLLSVSYSRVEIWDSIVERFPVQDERWERRLFVGWSRFATIWPDIRLFWLPTSG